MTSTKSMKRIHGREAIAKALGEHYTRKMNGKVWSQWDEQKRAYSIRGENLPSHPDLTETYPNGWSMLDYVKPSKAREILKADGYVIDGETRLDAKRIHSVTVKRMYDDSPDTSHLGEYANAPASEFSIDRAHDLECICQTYNHPTAEGVEHLQQAIECLEAQYDSLVPQDAKYLDSNTNARVILEALRDAECNCGSSCRWDCREYRYFNPSFNYVDASGKAKDLTDAEVIEYTRQDYQRMESLNNSQWGYVGIRAEAEVSVSSTDRNAVPNGHLIQRITSGGLWGVESDSDESYFAEVETEELAELRKQLAGIGFSQRAISAAFRQIEHGGDAR